MATPQSDPLAQLLELVDKLVKAGHLTPADGGQTVASAGVFLPDAVHFSFEGGAAAPPPAGPAAFVSRHAVDTSHFDQSVLTDLANKATDNDWLLS